jgi:hypothetical protein
VLLLVLLLDDCLLLQTKLLVVFVGLLLPMCILHVLKDHLLLLLVLRFLQRRDKMLLVYIDVLSQALRRAILLLSLRK